MAKEPFLELVLRKLRIRKIIRRIPPGSRLCDFGCGTHVLFLNTIKSSLTSGIGLDLRLQPQFDKKIALVKCDIDGDIPLKPNTLDVVTSLAVLEHLNNPANNLREAYRILKNGGLLILTTPSPASKKVLEFLAFRLGVLSRDMIGEHKQYFDRTNLRNMLTCSGFEDEKIKINGFQMGFNNLVIAKK